MSQYDHGRRHRRTPAEEAAAEELRESIRRRANEKPPRAGISHYALPVGAIICVYLVFRLLVTGGELELWLGLLAAVVMTGCVAWDVEAERRRRR